MSLLSHYSPLKGIWLPGVELVNPKGVVVVVGPNSSGKTLFLRDIENYLLTGESSFVVCEAIAAAKPDVLVEFVDDLIKQNYLQPIPGNSDHYRTFVPFFTRKDSAGRNDRPSFTMSHLQTGYDQFNAERGGSNPQWFKKIGMTLGALLSLEQRWRVCDKSGSFDYKQGTPDHPIQGLYVNSAAQERLAEETGEVFGNAAWLDISESRFYQLRVSGAKNRPPVGEMNNPLKAHHYPSIEGEGDGYRSYVGICLSLLVANRPVSLIDEPELCLHPPQARHIGRFIGQYAAIDHVTFVATHSSHVLRGILETGKQVTVIRIVRSNRSFKARMIEKEELVDNLRNPRTRAESILDGLFAKSVLLVESEGDREEYQAASEAISGHASSEVHIVPVGGTGGFAEPLCFYLALDIPVAIIADLDAVCDPDKIDAIADSLVSDSKSRQILMDDLRALAQLIKTMPASITETEAKEKLRLLAEESWSWTGGGDNALRRELTEIATQLKRIHRLKKGGLKAYDDNPNIQSKLLSIIDRFASEGMFFVPVGELEDWVPDLMEKVHGVPHSKTKRAAIAANQIREAPSKTGDIWHFTEKVFDFLERRRLQFAQSE